MVSESYFGLRDFKDALGAIDIAIEHSDYDGGNSNFRGIIQRKMA